MTRDFSTRQPMFRTIIYHRLDITIIELVTFRMPAVRFDQVYSSSTHWPGRFCKRLLELSFPVSFLSVLSVLNGTEWPRWLGQHGSWL